ncbi:MAG: hypothetical protein JRN24_02000, partial [Nitrososphaerota archaeon]|nr:hypothetical protein [Nitrososphaerota archaeon]
MEDFFTIRTVAWEDGAVKMIDQTALPGRLAYRTYTKPREVADAIKRMVVRGAPAIGVAAAMGVALAALQSKATTKEALMRELESAAAMLRATRPTAVNLAWGVQRVLRSAEEAPSAYQAKEAAAAEAKKQREIEAKRRALEAEKARKQREIERRNAEELKRQERRELEERKRQEALERKMHSKP